MLTQDPPLARRMCSPLSSRASLLLLPDPPPHPTWSFHPLKVPCSLNAALPLPASTGTRPKGLGTGWLCSVWWKAGQAPQPACGWCRERASPGGTFSSKLTKTLSVSGEEFLVKN